LISPQLVIEPPPHESQREKCSEAVTLAPREAKHQTVLAQIIEVVVLRVEEVQTPPVSPALHYNPIFLLGHEQYTELRLAPEAIILVAKVLSPS
jgi:hypothetical protein